LQALEESIVYRCFGEGEHHLNCREEHTYPKKRNPQIILKNESFSIDILFQPQSVKLNVDVGETIRLLIFSF